jgi:hypothetical protein
MSLNDAVAFWNGMSHEQVLMFAAAGGVILTRVHVYRYLKLFVVPLSLTFIAVRAIDPVHPSILELLSILINKIQNVHIQHAIYDLLGLVIVATVVSAIVTLISLDVTLAKKEILTWGFNQVRGVSFVKAILAKEQDKLEHEFDKDLKVRSRALGNMNTALPKKGMKAEAIIKLMRDATHEENVKWETGHVSGAVYNGQAKHIELLNEAFSMYSISNPLHPDIWPSIMKFDSEVIAMTADLVNGGDTGVCGSSSSVS